MKFEKTTDTNGSYLQGHVDVSYDTLVEVFGEPHGMHDDYKSDAEWAFEFEDGTIVTIYNYKDGFNYCGEDGTPLKYITDWHIGGYSEDAVTRVNETLGILEEI